MIADSISVRIGKAVRRILTVSTGIYGCLLIFGSVCVSSVVSGRKSRGSAENRCDYCGC